jgi:aminoglycoside phosphotransferase (APT) family kinase protein
MTPDTTALTFDQIKRLSRSLFPQRSIQGLEVLSGGLINTNIKVNFESQGDPVVVRLYRNGSDTCRKEVAIHDLVSSTVRVPRVLHAEPDGLGDLAPFAIIEFAQGITFQKLKRTKNQEAIRQASYSIGQTLATIGRFVFERPGRLLVEESNCLTVGSPFIDGPDTIPRILDRFLSSRTCQRRAGPELVQRLHDFGWSWSSRIPDLEEQPCLVHSDFGNRNILVREEEGVWVVAAILDWEFAFSGSSLLDVGHFLRYERKNEPLREPHFSRAFVEHGGQLPDNWRDIVKVIDLTALVECLTHEELPMDVELELLELINATLEHRDPR